GDGTLDGRSGARGIPARARLPGGRGGGRDRRPARELGAHHRAGARGVSPRPRRLPQRTRRPPAPGGGAGALPGPGLERDPRASARPRSGDEAAGEDLGGVPVGRARRRRRGLDSRSRVVVFQRAPGSGTAAPRGSRTFMNYRALGRTGLKVSEISLGSWTTYGGSVDESDTT